MTIEVNPKKFLNIKFVLNKDGIVTTFVYRKERKLPIPRISKSPKRYKRNTVIGDLHRSKRISSDLDTQVRAIKINIVMQVTLYVLSVVLYIISTCHLKIMYVSAIILPNLFDEKKPFLLFEVPNCKINDTTSKHFIKKFHRFPNEKYDVAIKWTPRKVKSLFKVKNSNVHPSCKIYKSECTCCET